MRKEVSIISMKTPWAIVVSAESLVMVSSGPGPGNMREERAEATMAPMISAGKRKRPRALIIGKREWLSCGSSFSIDPWVKE